MDSDHRRAATRWCVLGLGMALMISGASTLGARQHDHAPATATDAAHVPIVAAQEAFSTRGCKALQGFCDQAFRFEHWINVEDGVTIHVIERFTGRSVLRFPHRALLMLPATLATNAYFDATVDDDASYNALHQAASRGFFGFAMSYEGFGESTLPEDGRSVTAQRLLQHSGQVLEWIRTHRGVPQVDVFGTSIGAGLALALGGTESPINYHHVHRVVIATHVYKHFSPLAQAMFTPEFKAFLLGQPGGYFLTTPPIYAAIFSGLEPTALAWANATLPGIYPVGPLLEGFDLPFFDAAPGRVPLLQFWGSDSPTTPRADVEQLHQEYGGPHHLVVLDGAAHNPILEPVRHRFWKDVEAFLNAEAHDVFSVCEYGTGEHHCPLTRGMRVPTSHNGARRRAHCPLCRARP